MKSNLAVGINRHDYTADLLQRLGITDGAAVVDPFQIGFDLQDAVVHGLTLVEFRRVFKPKVISMEYHLPDIEFKAREHGLTLNQVANRQTNVPHLSLTGSVWRAQAYRRNICKELDSVKDLLIV